MTEIPLILAAEGDEPVDDLQIRTASGARLFVQAKRSAGLTSGSTTPFGKALAQFARAIDGGLGEGDRLVLASGQPTSPLRALGKALDRDRLASQGSPSPREARALCDFERIAGSQLDDQRIAVLRRHLAVWHVDPSRGDGAIGLAARLEGPVARIGGGSQTARALADTVRYLARERGGLDSTGLVRALVERKAPLERELDPSGAVARATALLAHRRRAVSAGRTLRLLGVRGGLSRLPFEPADCEVKVDADDEERGFGRSVAQALRRRGRVLLIGSPGGGKSTALRVLAAHWAGRDGWPTPVLVHLQRLAGSDRAPSATLIEVATESTVGDEGIALHAALSQELASGRCLVLLDGLDEVRAGRVQLLERLAEWLDHLHSDTEVVIATRPLAAEEAQGLELSQLALRPPDDPDATIDAILAAAAQTVDESDRSSWIVERRRWIDEVMRRDAALRATPLMVVVIAVEAASSSVLSEVTTGRAVVLRSAMEKVVDAWELERRRRGSIALGPLTGKRAANALVEGLQAISRELLESPSPSGTAALATFSEELGVHYGLPPGDARAAAEETFGFWEEAGLMRLDGDVLTAPIRVFAEVGYAWWASEADETNQQAWILRCRRDDSLWPSLALAAGLSPEVHRAWVEAYVNDGSGPELCALLKGHAEGAKLDHETLSEVIGAAIARDLYTNDAEDVAWALARLDLAEDLRSELRRHLVGGLPAERRVIVDAWVTARWEERGPEADRRLRAALDASPRPPASSAEEDPRVIRLPDFDNHYHEAFEAVSLRLAQISRSDAERVVDTLTDGSYELRAQLPRVLRGAGHRDLAGAVEEKLAFRSPLTRWDQEDYEFSKRFMLEAAEEVDAPGDLSYAQRRRLDDLTDFMRSVAAEWIFPWWPKKRPDELRSYFAVMARLAGFDTAVISAQAQLVLDDVDAGEATDDLLWDGGSAREPDHWDSLTHQREGLDTLVEVLGSAPDAVMVRAAIAIVSAPDQLEAYRLVEARAELLKNWDLWFVSRLLVACAPDANSRVRPWLADSNPVRRRVAAEVYGRRWATAQESLEELQTALADEDEGVREAAVRELEDAQEIPARMRAVLTKLREGPRMPWRCGRCGTDNAPGQSGCSKCSTSGPSVRHYASKILDR